MINLYLMLRNFLLREEGQDMIEYALIAALISIAAITVMNNVAGPAIRAAYQWIEAGLAANVK